MRILSRFVQILIVCCAAQCAISASFDQSKIDSKKNVCAVCQIAAKHRCSACKVAYYCSKEHQSEDWRKGHKQNCRNFKEYSPVQAFCNELVFDIIKDNAKRIKEQNEMHEKIAQIFTYALTLYPTPKEAFAYYLTLRSEGDLLDESELLNHLSPLYNGNENFIYLAFMLGIIDPEMTLELTHKMEGVYAEYIRLRGRGDMVDKLMEWLDKNRF